MTPGSEPTIEDRLRGHYQHLRAGPPADDQSPRRPPSSRVLAVAAGLTILLAGGAYLAQRSASSGEPLRADVGAEAEETPFDAVSDPAAGGPDRSTDAGRDPDDAQRTTPSTVEGGPTSTTADAGTSPEPGSGQDNRRSAGINADGSPVAPQPGTRLPPPEATQAMAYGTWEPGRADSCSQEVHDRYWVYGPDGAVYPTYHPPIDPATGCIFGHEHGRDPAGSDLADIPFPFGYVNEQQAATGAEPAPVEHVSHKIEWYNDGGYYNDGSPLDRHDQICDVAYKIHLDSHSAAAFDNNANEVFVYARCENGSELIYRALHRFGDRGQFELHCDQGAGPTVVVGPGDGAGGNGIDGREIPGSRCFEDQVLVPEGRRSNWFPFDERWILYQSVDSADFGRFFVQLQFYVDLPARYWDGEAMARTVDLCYVTGDRQVRDDDLCSPMRQATAGSQVAWDDPASPFDGTARSVFMGDIRLDNNSGQTDWYTDINGGVWSQDPFPGSIRQHVGTTPIRAAASYRPDPVRSITFADDLGIHPPN